MVDFWTQGHIVSLGPGAGAIDPGPLFLCSDNEEEETSTATVRPKHPNTHKTSTASFPHTLTPEPE